MLTCMKGGIGKPTCVGTVCGSIPAHAVTKLIKLHVIAIGLAANLLGRPQRAWGMPGGKSAVSTGKSSKFRRAKQANKGQTKHPPMRTSA